MGSILEPPPLEALLNPFAEFGANSVKACRDCWARYVCSGGCPAAWVRIKHHLTETDPLICNFAKSLAEMAIKGYAKVNLNKSKPHAGSEERAGGANNHKNDLLQCI